MPLAPSFKEYYSHQDVGAGGNGNVKAFNMTMDFKTNKADALKAFNNADGIIITAGLPNKVKLIHGLKDFGNTFGHPNSKICGHIRMNDTAFVGVIDHVDALSFVQYNTPTRKKFAECIRMEAMRALQPPDITTGWSYDGTPSVTLDNLARFFQPYSADQRDVHGSGHIVRAYVGFELPGEIDNVRAAFVDGTAIIGGCVTTLSVVQDQTHDCASLTYHRRTPCGPV